MNKNKLFLITCIIFLSILFNYFSYWLIPEKLVKHVYIEALRYPQLFPTKMQKYLVEPDACISLAKDIKLNEDLKEHVFTLPASLRSNEVKYIRHQKLDNNLMVYYVSAMPTYENKMKVDARILLIKTNYKWLVKSITIDLISPLESQPALIFYE